jgi:cyclase
MASQTGSGSKHFVLHQLADGIYAAVAEKGGFAICNAGLIDLGGQILVFDSFLTPQAATDLRRRAVDLFERPPQIVINSHYHNDHIWGNQAFAGDALIFSSTRTRELIATAGMEEFQWYSSHAAQRLEAVRAQYQASTDESQKSDLLLWMGEYAGVVESLPSLKVTLPDITFDRQLEIHGAKHTARLVTFEGAHTASDTALYLPEAGIIFMSDLLFVGFHPYLADGDPLRLLSSLKELSLLDAACYVPGHGPVGTTDDLKLLIQYIEHCYETATRLVEAGNANETVIKALKIPVAFQHWQISQFYSTNIRFLCERLSSAAAA